MATVVGSAGCCMPVVCNDRCRMVDDMAQFIDSYGRPCDHAETVATVEVPPFSVHRRNWWTFFFRNRGSAWWQRWRVVCCSFAAFFGLRPSGR